MIIMSVLALATATGCAQLEPAAAPSGTEWPVYGADQAGTRFSPLTQINATNVESLAVAWTYRTRETEPQFAAAEEGALEVTPLVVDGVMYISTPLGRVMALDPATGMERWAYDPQIDRTIEYGDFTSRGVATWLDASAAPRSTCRRRIIAPIIDGRLVALDAADGKPCADFGRNGFVELKPSLRIAPFEPPAFEITSPPIVVGDVVITGSAIADNSTVAPASGEVRAFNVRTGAPLWTWDPIPQDSTDAAWATWRSGSARRTGAANVWSVMVADSALGLVYAPTSSPAPDYFGGERLGANRYANSVVALRIATGQVAWSFQTVHHDLWDYDNASPPALVDLVRNGARVPAVLQATKTGQLFVLNRETGEPIFPVEERAVPRSDVPGEEASPTQPFSAVTPPLSPHHLSADSAWGMNEAERDACRRAIRALRNDGVFTPPSLRGSLVMPSNIGGAHWGGVAVDTLRRIAVVPVNRIPAQVQLIPAATLTEREADRLEESTGFQYTHMDGTPYVMRRGYLTSPNGLPCSPPPWGALVAVDLNTGLIRWTAPLGSMPLPDESRSGTTTGSPNLGGPIVTASGLVFISATLDRRFRAFDIETGREVWAVALPAGGKATPMTYQVAGRQFVVIAAGGGGRFGSGDHIVAFELPSPPR
jgi:quinoprotein glucose dehydrogenase